LDREKSNSGINGNGQIGLFVEEAVSVSGEVDGSSDRAKAGKVQGAGLEVVSVDEFANIGDGHEERDGESDNDRSEDSGDEGSGNGDSGDDDSEGNSGLLYVAFFEKDNTIVFSSDLEDIETVDRGADSGDRGDRGDISDNSEVAKVYFDKKIEQKEDFWKRAKKIFDGGFEEVVFFGWKDFCEFLYFNDLVGFDSTKKSEEAHLDETKEILMMDFSKTRLFDTQLAAYFLSTGKRDYSFKELAFSYAGFVVDNQSPASPAEAVNYLQALRVVSQKLREDLVKHQSEERFIKEGGDLELDCLKDVDQVMSISCTAMTDIGIAIDRDQLGEIQADFEQRIDKVEKEIFDSVGHEFNINSPKQLSEVLFEELDLPPQKRTKTGFSTSESVLKQLKDMHPCVENVLEYRELMKLNSTYVKPLINFSKKSKDGRIHSSFNQITTSTGRLSSTEPNVQNIPTRTDLGKKIKGMFVAPEGRELISADYSQIELRIMAHLSQDKNMIDDFRSEKDFHTQTAVRLLDVEKDSVSQDDRRIAKTINFGVLYGQSPYGLAKQLDIDRSQASDYIESYFDKYSGVKSYLEKTINFAKKYGYLETLLGRRRYFGSIASSNRNARAGAEREAINLPIQGSAADIMRIAMNRVYEWILENDPTSHLLLQIHDELVVETSKSKSSEIAPIIKGIMENVIDLGVPLLVEPNIGPNLREAK
jgi:DNA polymerase I